MKQAKLDIMTKLDIMNETDFVSLYTIIFENSEISEFEKFMEKFKDNAVLQRDYQIILLALDKIASHGALERNFRPEGKMNDNVVALPIEKSKLRLYCLRLTDKILILGNGGEKTTKTYEESEELKGYVIDLQKFKIVHPCWRNRNKRNKTGWCRKQIF